MLSEWIATPNSACVDCVEWEKAVPSMCVVESIIWVSCFAKDSFSVKD